MQKYLALCLMSIVLGCTALAHAQNKTQESARAASWPTHGWAQGKPGDVGLDEKTLAAFDADIASGKYFLVDSFAVFRCGKQVFERNYKHDYGRIYAKDARTRGALNPHLTGPYNYFDPDWHPYYRGTMMHSMQSVTKTVTSIILGIAITRGDFKAGLDTPIMKYFEASKVQNLDQRKAHITLRNVLTMSTGLQWNEAVAYDDPTNDAAVMEAKDDWVQYVIDRPMVAEPGTVFNYSSGVSELLAYVFKQETGQDVETYGEKVLFGPLGMKHYWKRTPKGLPDTEGGLFLESSDLAKIGYLFLHDGQWAGDQIVSKDWVKQSLAPAFDTGEEGSKYGFKWWLFPRTESNRMIWAAVGFGGQRLMVFPQEDLIVTFTGWNILANESPVGTFIKRIEPAIRPYDCTERGR